MFSSLPNKLFQITCGGNQSRFQRAAFPFKRCVLGAVCVCLGACVFADRGSETGKKQIQQQAVSRSIVVDRWDRRVPRQMTWLRSKRSVWEKQQRRMEVLGGSRGFQRVSRCLHTPLSAMPTCRCRTCGVTAFRNRKPRYRKSKCVHVCVCRCLSVCPYTNYKLLCPLVLPDVSPVDQHNSVPQFAVAAASV